MILLITHEIEREYYRAAVRPGVPELLERRAVDLSTYFRILAGLCGQAEFIAPRGKAPACRDEDDRKYLHCALVGDAGYLVSFDSDLLDLQTIGDAPIVTPRDFLASADNAGVTLIR